jgi:hypothetical protein
MTSDTLHDNAEPRMNEYLERAMTRGVEIRRRRRLLQATLAVIAVCLVIVPSGILTKSAPRTGVTVGAGAYQEVSWQHVTYPGLNVANATYPVEMGCGPGFPGMFPVGVQQVTYIRPPGGSETLAVVLVHCASATPTPSALYAFAPGRSATHPRLLQVLLAPPNPKVDVLWYASHIHWNGHTVSLAARGVTTSGSNCCPQVSTTMRWNVAGHDFVKQSEPVRPLSGG